MKLNTKNDVVSGVYPSRTAGFGAKFNQKLKIGRANVKESGISPKVNSGRKSGPRPGPNSDPNCDPLGPRAGKSVCDTLRASRQCVNLAAL
jgi:hypothetical protein